MSKITKQYRVSALRNGMIIRSSRQDVLPKAFYHAASVEMAHLGFLVNADDLNGMSKNALADMIADARQVIGADRNMRPVYPGFPKQVQELSTATLIFEQIMHYWSAGTLMPNYPDVVREGLPIEDMVRAAREVSVMTAGKAARQFIQSLTTSGVALSEDDRDLLAGSVTLADPSLAEVVAVAKTARHGENMQCLVKAYVGDRDISASEAVIAFMPACDNLDQVLRVVLTTSSAPSADHWNNNYSLAVNTLANRAARAVRMRNLNRAARRAIMSRVAELSDGYKADALVSRQDLWRRVMRMVHPYDLSLDEKSKRAADVIHGNIEYRTFNSLVESGIEDGEIEDVVSLLSEYQPGNLLRRLVALLHASTKKAQVKALENAVRKHGARSAVTTLVSAYNGVIIAGENHARVNRVAGMRNTILTADVRPVDAKYVQMLKDALQDALRGALGRLDAPKSEVGIVGAAPVPLVRRDLATTDRVVDRGSLLTPAGEGDTIRIFGHWNNNMRSDGYMDCGAVILDKEFNAVETITWNSWKNGRKWATYSGDKLVYPGDNAAEYIDLNIKGLKDTYPEAAWVAMTIQSWSGFPMNEVDMIAGVMLRSKPDSGEVFDPRTVTTAFKPTTTAFQSIPLVFNIDSGEMIWVDSSNGSTRAGVSATDDSSVGLIVYDEVARPRLTMGELATLWAEAHDVKTVETEVDRDLILNLLN